MKPINITLDKSLEAITIVGLQDLHVGDEHCNYDLIKKWVEYISLNDEVYCVLNGDLMNNALKRSVSDVYKDTMTPQEQLHYLTELLLPIKNKILCITTGNHERRSYKETNLDPSAFLADRLGLLDRYRPDGAWLNIKVGEIKGKRQSNGSGKTRQVQYSLYVTHEPGSINPKTIVNKMRAITDVDIYMVGHIHTPGIYPSAFFRLDVRNNTVALTESLVVVCGSTQDYGGFSQIKSMTPSSQRNPVLILNGTKKEFNAFL